MRVRTALNGFLLTMVVGAIGTGALVACGSSSSDSSASTTPLSGNYIATDPGIFRNIDFIDATHYSLNRANCAGHDTGCTETGTYVRDDAAGTITFNRDDGYFSLSLPFGPAANTAPVDTSEDSLHLQDLTSGDGGLTSGTGGSITTTTGPLLKTAQVGNQNFVSSPSSSSDGGGVQLVTPVTAVWQPMVINQQGTLVNAKPAVITPTVVTVTWNADPNAAAEEAYVDYLKGTDFWPAATSEYGVGPIATTQHVRLKTAPPTTLSTEKLPAWISAQISAKGSTWPAPTAGTYYALFIPSATSKKWTEQNQLGCEEFTGEHSSATYKGTNYAYAIMLECGGQGFALADIEATAAHELAEGSADPFDNLPGYIGFRKQDLAWDILQDFQDEIGDACEDFANINYVSGSFTSQRIWSNAAAQAGHDPCVPAPAGVAYFNVAPIGMTTVSVKTPKDYQPYDGSNNVPATMSGLGYSIKKGTGMSIPIKLTSDMAGTGPWTVSAMEGAPENFPNVPATKNLTLKLDKTSGSAGDTINLSVTVKTSSTAGELITISSTMNGVTHYAPILIAN